MFDVAANPFVGEHPARGFHLVECIVDHEAKIWRMLQSGGFTDLVAQFTLVLGKRCNGFVLVFATKWHHEDGSDMQIGRHPNFRYRDRHPVKIGIMHVAMHEHVAQFAPDQLAHAELTLRGALAMMGMLLGHAPIYA